MLLVFRFRAEDGDTASWKTCRYELCQAGISFAFVATCMPHIVFGKIPCLSKADRMRHDIPFVPCEFRRLLALTFFRPSKLRCNLGQDISIACHRKFHWKQVAICACDNSYCQLLGMWSSRASGSRTRVSANPRGRYGSVVTGPLTLGTPDKSL